MSRKRKQIYYFPSPYAQQRADRLERLRHVIEVEGHALTNRQLMERFPRISDNMIRQIREELNIPAPSSEYVTEKDLDQVKNIPPAPPLHSRKRDKYWRESVRAARERAKSYTDK